MHIMNPPGYHDGIFCTIDLNLSAHNRLMMTRNLKFSLACFVVIMLCNSLTLSVQAQTNTVFQDDFEGSSIYSGWDAKEACCSYSLTNSTNFKRTGKKSLRVELRKSDSEVGGSKRTELTDNSYPVPPETNRRWWAFSNYLPSDFGRDSVHEILAQWHDRPKTSSVSLSPPLSLQIYKGNWIIELRYDSVDVNSDKGANIKLKTFVLGPWQKGVWNDWVFNYNYSYNNDGYLKVWKNGVLVLDYKGKNYYNGSYDPFFKIGMYRWVWSSSWPSNLEKSVYSTRVYYVDNVKVGNKNAVLQDFLIPNPVPTNVSPIAYLRYKQSIPLPTNTATISGSSCVDPDGSIVSYKWSIESGPSTPTLASTTAMDLKISGMILGTYVYRLTVTDNQGATASYTSIVEMTGSGTANKLPIITMGATKILTLPTNSVGLTASGTYDPDGSISAYQWTQESGPSTAVISNANSVSPTVSSLVKGSYYFKLKVTDNKGGYNTDYVQVLVEGTATSASPSAPTNTKPVANAGSGQTFQAIYSTISLNGKASYDPDGYLTKYLWAQESGPASTISTPDSAATVVRNFTVGTYVFRLVVTDNGGLRDTSRVTINVLPATTTAKASLASGTLPVDQAPALVMASPGGTWQWPGKNLVMYPNPVQQQLVLQMNSPYTGNSAVQIYSLQGGLLYQERFQKTSAVYTRQLNLGGLPAGTYLVYITEGNKKFGVQRMVKAN